MTECVDSLKKMEISVPDDVLQLIHQHPLVGNDFEMNLLTFFELGQILLNKSTTKYPILLVQGKPDNKPKV